MTTMPVVAVMVLALTSMPASAQNRSTSEPSSKCCSVAVEALRDAARIKPGMKRADLAAMFARQEGPDFIVETVYIWKSCPYIKIRVSFTLSDPKSQKESPSDIVKSVSDPYIQYPVKD